MADHPPEQHIRQGEKAAKKADPHGMGEQSDQDERGNHEPKGQPTADRQQTETAQTNDSEK